MQLVDAWASNGFYAESEPASLGFCGVDRSPETFPLDSFRLRASDCVQQWLDLRQKDQQFLFGLLVLHEKTDAIHSDGLRTCGSLIGRDLWRLISPQSEGIPPDFETRHLIQEQDWIAVWNRNGVAVACRKGDIGRFAQLRRSLTDLAQVIQFIRHLTLEEGSDRRSPDSAKRWLDRIRQEQFRLIQIEAGNFGHGDRVLRRLLEAMNLPEISERISDLAESYRDEGEARRGDRISDVLAVASILSLVAGYFQIEGVGILREVFAGSTVSPGYIHGVGVLGLVLLMGFYAWFRRRG
jgi:hypothetical protein